MFPPQAPVPQTPRQAAPSMAQPPAEQPDPKEQLIAVLKDKLSVLLKEHVEQDTDPEKTAQFRMARRNHLYFEGKQNLAPVWTANGMADFSSVGSPISPGRTSEDSLGMFDYVFNFIRGDGLKAISVTGKAPTVNAVPDDPEDDEALVKSQDANAVSAHFDSQWNDDEIQKQIMFVFWVFGPVFIYTRYVANGQEHGYHEEPEMGTQDIPLSEGGYQCNNCGVFTPSENLGDITCPKCDSPLTAYQPPQTTQVPVQIGVKRYQKGTVEIDICDITTVTTQFDLKNLKKTPYLRYEYEAPKGGLIAKYPKLRKKMESDADPGGGSSASSQTGRDTRAVTNSPTGIRYYRKDRWRFTQDWLLPEMYEYEKEENIRALLLQNFPNGLKISSVDGEIQDLEDEKLTDKWCARPPSVGKRLHGDPLCSDAIPGQDLYNDGQNMAAETEYHGIPATVVDNQVFDKKSMQDRPPNPAEMIFVNLQGQDPHKLMANLPTATFSEHLLPWLGGVREDMRDISGTSRSIAGLEGPSQTAEEARIRQNAALKQLSIAYDNTRHLWVDIKTNACREAAKYGVGTIKSPVSTGLLGYESRAVDLAKFSLSGVHFEVDEGMPASFSEERDRINKVFQESPQMASMIGLDNPINSAAVNKYIGVRGLYDPRAQQRIYVKRTIDKLLKEKPIQTAGPDGSPQTQPSIPIRQFEDNHSDCAAMVQVWASTGPALEQMDTNPDGYQNVIAWGIAHHQASTPPPPPPPPARMSVALDLSKTDPQTAATVMKDYNLLPGNAPPPQMMPPPQGRVGTSNGPPSGPPGSGGAPGGSAGSPPPPDQGPPPQQGMPQQGPMVQ